MASEVDIDEVVKDFITQLSIGVDDEVRRKIDDAYHRWRRLSLEQTHAKRKSLPPQRKNASLYLDPEDVSILRKVLKKWEGVVKHKNKGVSLVYSPAHALMSVRMGITNQELEEGMDLKPMTRFAYKRVKAFIAEGRFGTGP